MDTRVKQCFIIGGFCIAIGLLLILLESLDLSKNLNTEEDYMPWLIDNNIFNLSLCTIATIFSILLVVGVHKKRLAFVTPWLLAAFAGSTFTMYYAVNLLILFTINIEVLVPLLAVAGIETLILYPVLSLYRDIWLKNSEAKKQKLQDKLNHEKKMKISFVDLDSKYAV